MNIAYVPDETFFWWILGFAVIFLLIMFIIWAITQKRAKR